MTYKVLAIVVAYGHTGTVEECIESCLRQEPIAGTVVVDNSRLEGIADVCSKLGVPYCDPGGNLGYARAANKGVGMLGHEFTHVVILNPDLVLFDLRPVLAALESEGATIATGSLLTASGGVEGNARRFATPWLELLRAVSGSRRLAQIPRELDGRSERIEQAAGSLLLLRMHDWKRLGGFDERFELYYEDVDLCRRATQNGSVIRVRRIVGRHGGGVSYRSNQHQGFVVGSVSRTRYLMKWYGNYYGRLVAVIIGCTEYVARSVSQQAEGQEARNSALAAIWREVVKPGAVVVLGPRIEART